MTLADLHFKAFDFYKVFFCRDSQLYQYTYLGVSLFADATLQDSPQISMFLHFAFYRFFQYSTTPHCHIILVLSLESYSWLLMSFTLIFCKSSYIMDLSKDNMIYCFSAAPYRVHLYLPALLRWNQTVPSVRKSLLWALVELCLYTTVIFRLWT